MVGAAAAKYATDPTRTMRAKEPCEIRVALIGYVSVGKTTVLNALFGNKYGEVSMQRTTALVNHFRVSTKDQDVGEEPTQSSPPENEQGREASDDSWPMGVESTMSADSVFAESVADNAALRNNGSVQTKTFDIVIDEVLHPMRPDTKLVIVDIPGINEAGTDDKYRHYVTKHWHTYDVAAVVMDGTQGVNTKEQMNLLLMIQSLQNEEKKIPTLFISNKNDDPDDEEQLVMFKEFQTTVKNIFGGYNQVKNALEGGSGEDASEGAEFQKDLPIVIPFSARLAFLYRCGARLTFDQFKALDVKLINRLGKETFGRVWRSYSNEEKLQKAYEAVQDPELNRVALADTSFDALQKALALCIGDYDQQLNLIQYNVSTSLQKKVEDGNGDLVGEIKAAVARLDSVGSDVKDLPSIFWKGYDRLEESVWLSSLVSNRICKEFAAPAEQLFMFYCLAKDMDWHNEYPSISRRIKNLVFTHVGRFLGRQKQDEAFSDTNKDATSKPKMSGRPTVTGYTPSQVNESEIFFRLDGKKVTRAGKRRPPTPAPFPGGIGAFPPFGPTPAPLPGGFAFPTNPSPPSFGRGSPASANDGSIATFQFGKSADPPRPKVSFAKGDPTATDETTEAKVHENVDDDRTLTVKDRSLIFGSMLLFLNTPTATYHFGRLKLELESRYAQSLSALTDDKHPVCPNCANYMKALGTYCFCTNCYMYLGDRFPASCPCGCGSIWNQTEKHHLCKEALCRVEVRVVSDVRRIVADFVDQKLQGGNLIPVDAEKYQKFVTISVPESPKDPTHYGHVIWKCCSLLEKMAQDGH